MSRASEHDLLVLHAVRILGFADTRGVAERFGLDGAATHESLLDAESRGWTTRSSFADLDGWSLTTAGRVEGQRLLAAELAATGQVSEVRDVHLEFLPLNARLQQACTDWQLRPTPGDRLTPNDHADPEWDVRVLDELTAVGDALGPLAGRLEGVLARLGGYDTRFSTALRRARAGDAGGIDGTGTDSCHRVWFELHEDLIATLGLSR